MKFTVTCSTADGDQTRDFNNWEDAHHYANEWMNGFAHWNHRHFNNVESDEHINLWQTRKGECVHITEASTEDEIPTLIEWMRDNIERPMAFSSHACENCWDYPGDNIIVGDSGVPFQLCDFCKGKYVNSLPPDKQKRLI